ncbi:integrase core domain-containing protein [Variovorax fucosicus]|uniref:integrase core domain-containing protein n=1 Tax=Variovorax fucosicus TaxID=3053517 RepID=UPI0040378B27
MDSGSHDFREVLKEHGITNSICRKASCWDNACSEALFGSMNVERLYGQRFKTKRESKDETVAWLLWYNRARRHSTALDDWPTSGNAVRAGMACQSTKASQFMNSSMGYGFQGQGQTESLSPFWAGRGVMRSTNSLMRRVHGQPFVALDDPSPTAPKSM